MKSSTATRILEELNQALGTFVLGYSWLDAAFLITSSTLLSRYEVMLEMRWVPVNPHVGKRNMREYDWRVVHLTSRSYPADSIRLCLFVRYRAMVAGIQPAHPSTLRCPLNL